ncbi:MAG TPA: hypothetical protein PLC87_12040 [Bacteroidales bacterium]|nr:hypothetical protein [Bacteroidales bacterium]
MEKIYEIKLEKIEKRYDRFFVSAELRVEPYSSLAGKYVYDTAVNLVKTGLTDINYKKEVDSNGSSKAVFYLISTLDFLPQVYLDDVFKALEKEQQKLQELFTKSLDEAYKIEKISKLAVKNRSAK